MSGMLLAVTHDTRYRYGTRVETSYHMAALQPLADAHQEVLSFELQIDPPPASRMQNADVYGNGRDWFSLYAPHDHLQVRAVSRVQVRPRFALAADADSQPWEQVAASLAYRAGQPFFTAAEFATVSPYVPRLPSLAEFAAPSFPAARGVLSGARHLMQRIHDEFTYDGDSTDVNTPVSTVLEARRGVCQDFAHLMIGALRSVGLAARYVSGYLLTEPPPGQPRLIGADASHAWVSVWCPPLGWIEMDPTNGRICTDGYVRVAVGRDYGDVVPLRGVIRGGGDHSLTVAVTVQPV